MEVIEEADSFSVICIPLRNGRKKPAESLLEIWQVLFFSDRLSVIYTQILWQSGRL
jgi:hypothetical protein